MNDHYAILGIEPGADLKELKKAYRRLAQKWHPDKNDSPEAAERFKEIASAFEVLSDAGTRAQYDAARGEVSAGGLPAAFCDDFNHAVGRARSWVLDVIVPHYSRYSRGMNAEMALRMMLDRQELLVPTNLTPASFFRRYWVNRRLKNLEVTIYAGNAWSGTFLEFHRGLIELGFVPSAFYQANIRTAEELDEVIIELMISRVAQVVCPSLHPGLLDAEDGLKRAQMADEQVLTANQRKWGLWAAVVLICSFFLFSGVFHL